MGLPITKLVVATNSNDILARFWKSGAYEKVDSSASVPQGAAAPANGASDGKQGSEVDGVKETLSPAMDILVSSNFERLLWYLAYEGLELSDAETRRGACETIHSWMQKVKSHGRVQVPTKVLELARRDFFAERVSDEQVRAKSSRVVPECKIDVSTLTHRHWKQSKNTLNLSQATLRTLTLQ